MRLDEARRALELAVQAHVTDNEETEVLAGALRLLLQSEALHRRECEAWRRWDAARKEKPEWDARVQQNAWDRVCESGSATDAFLKESGASGAKANESSGRIPDLRGTSEEGGQRG